MTVWGYGERDPKRLEAGLTPFARGDAYGPRPEEEDDVSIEQDAFMEAVIELYDAAREVVEEGDAPLRLAEALRACDATGSVVQFQEGFFQGKVGES